MPLPFCCTVLPAVARRDLSASDRSTSIWTYCHRACAGDFSDAANSRALQRSLQRFARYRCGSAQPFIEGERHDDGIKFIAGRGAHCCRRRAAPFLPPPKPGLIVVDEEHEAHYKQEEPPLSRARRRSHARENGKCIILLGSATPSIESYHNAPGKYRLLNLTQR